MAVRVAAIYGRYSTDEQKATSIEDQVRKCHALAARKGFTVEEKWVFADHAISGGTAGAGKRTEFMRLLDAIEAREIDVVFADEVSRLSRNYLDGARIIDFVQRTGLRVITDDGIDTETDKSWDVLWQWKLVSAVQQVQSTAGEVIRGMKGQLHRGFMIAQAPYGYVAQRVRTEDGTAGTKWLRDEDKARIVMNMYQWRFSGTSLLAIATRLNAEGIPCPAQSRCKGPTWWRPGTVHRLLGNPIYKGVFIWNGSSYTRAKARQKRKTLETQEFLRPELALVSEEVWAACNPSAGKETFRGGGKHALSGVIHCGYCDASLSIGGGPKSFHVACPQCEQAKMVNGATHFIGYSSLQAVKQALNWGIRQVFTGDSRAEFRERLRERLTRGPAREEEELEARLKELESRKARAKLMMKDPRTPQDWLKEELIEVAGEMDSVAKRLASIRRATGKVTKELVQAQIAVDPLAYLEKLLSGEPAPQKVRAVLKRLISRFQFVARKGRGHSVFELEFRPGALAAELSGTEVVDNDAVAFRITVVTNAKRPVTWEVTGERI